MPAKKTFFGSYLATLGLLFSVAVTLNIIVDPFAIFQWVDTPWLKEYKFYDNTFKINHPRAIALAIKREKIDTLLVGSSRVMQGLDTKNPVFDGSRVFNAGIAGAGIDDVKRIVRFAAYKPEMKRYVVALDYISFFRRKNQNSLRRPKFTEQYKTPNRHVYRMKDVVGSWATKNAILSIVPNFDWIRNGNMVRLGERRQRPNSTRRDFDRSYEVYRKKYCSLAYYPENINAVRDIITVSQANGIELNLFIQPVHSAQIQLLKKCHQYKNFLQWKKSLVNLLQTDMQSVDYAKTALWDFSGYNSVTSEALPHANSSERMHWYINFSHYSKATGDLVLFAMLGNEAQKKHVPEDFGQQLFGTGIERSAYPVKDESVNLVH